MNGITTLARFALPGIVTAAWLAIPASAAIVTYSTNSAQTGFGGTSLILNSSSGAAATLTFDPLPPTPVGTPSGISYGGFTLSCPACSTQTVGTGATFAAFSFNLVVTDSTDGATGVFVGTSAGGNVWSDASQIVISWLPATLGPGANNASSGNFGATTFQIVSPTVIVAPNTGDPAGFTSVTGFVDTQVSTVVPEPSTFATLGASLLVVGLYRRRRTSTTQ
jgi:hypothetical protein